MPSAADRPVAIVTGAARGIGRTIAMRLAREGYRVAVCDRDMAGYEQFRVEREATAGLTPRQSLEQAGAEVLDAQVDLTDVDQVLDFVNSVHDAWGRIDLLVCNAGGSAGDIAYVRASAFDLADPATQQYLLSSTADNYYSVVYSVLATLPHMIAAGSGSVVFISSTAGNRPSATGEMAFYGGGKAAAQMYLRTVAQDVAPHGIRVNSIAPGFIATGRALDRLERLHGENAPNEIAAQIPVRRWGRAEDIAEAVVYLGSSASGFVTGQTLAVDGGDLRHS